MNNAKLKTVLDIAKDFECHTPIAKAESVTFLVRCDDSHKLLKRLMMKGIELSKITCTMNGANFDEVTVTE